MTPISRTPAPAGNRCAPGWHVRLRSRQGHARGAGLALPGRRPQTPTTTRYSSTYAITTTRPPTRCGVFARSARKVRVLLPEFLERVRAPAVLQLLRDPEGVPLMVPGDIAPFDFHGVMSGRRRARQVTVQWSTRRTRAQGSAPTPSARMTNLAAAWLLHGALCRVGARA